MEEIIQKTVEALKEITNNVGKIQQSQLKMSAQHNEALKIIDTNAKYLLETRDDLIKVMKELRRVKTKLERIEADLYGEKGIS